MPRRPSALTFGNREDEEMIARMEKRYLPVYLQLQCGRTLGLSLLFLLATTTILKAGDFSYTTNIPDTNTVTITGYTGSGGMVVIPDTIEGKTVTSIGFQAFVSCANPAGITICDSVTNIGFLAFSSRSLTSITVAAHNSFYSSVDGVLFNKDQTTLIQYPANKPGCYTVPISVTTIGDFAFSCGSLTSIAIPASVTSIGDKAFNSCTNLTPNVTIPISVTNIGISAFGYCTCLTAIMVDEDNPCYSSLDRVLFN